MQALLRAPWEQAGVGVTSGQGHPSHLAGTTFLKNLQVHWGFLQPLQPLGRQILRKDRQSPCDRSQRLLSEGTQRRTSWVGDDGLSKLGSVVSVRSLSYPAPCQGGSMIWGFPGHGYGTERSQKSCGGRGEPVTSWKAFSSCCSLGTWSCGGEHGHGRSVVQQGLSALSVENTRAGAGELDPAPLHPLLASMGPTCVWHTQGQAGTHIRQIKILKGL